MKRKLPMNARIAVAALTGALRPVLAQDAQIGDLAAIVGNVKSLKNAKTREGIGGAIAKEYGDKLAADATLDHIAPLLVQLANDEEDDPKAKVADDEDEDDDKPKDKPAEDEDDDEKVDKTAMDAAIDAAVKRTESVTVARMQAIHQAERDVRPLIGDLAVAQDSAENVYKLALDAAKIDVTGVHPSAYRAMVDMLKKQPTQVAAPAATLAQDSANGFKSFAEMFPNAGKMKGGV